MGFILKDLTGSLRDVASRLQPRSGVENGVSLENREEERDVKKGSEMV